MPILQRTASQALLQQLGETSIYPGLTLPLMIISDGSGGDSLQSGGRTLLLVWSLFLLGGFALAFALDPDPRGYGTHQRLGLPPCTIRQFLGFPCPSCGMTTSFSLFVRGDFQNAMRANAAGCLLAAICCLQIPWCWWSIFRRRLCWVSDPGRTALWLLIGVVTVCGLNWLVQVGFA